MLALPSDRILVPVGVEWFECLGDLQRGRKPPKGMEFDHDIHLLAYCLSDLSKGIKTSVQRFV
jgi:hypothetical protein